MRIVLCALDAQLIAAWECVLDETHPALRQRCRCVRGDIMTLTVDGAVSPTNSFGFMDGGLDLHYTRCFGPQVQARLQGYIKTLPFQELLVGQAVGIETDSPSTPWCVCAPTMRTPMRLHDAVPAYLATRAAVAEAQRLGLNSLAIPGMGTGTGGIAPLPAARAMLDGVRDALYPQEFPSSLGSVTGYAS